jgi:Tol biopolymer transport system component
LASLALARWVGPVAISPDGAKLVVWLGEGLISAPSVLDLDTGETTSLGDATNRQGSIAWSPDGQWLAYVFTDDLVVWSLPDDRSWRITLDRRLDSLMWS